MKLVTSNGELDLPVDFSFELEYNNPFFSDEGDASVPATIPATPNNLRVLDNIHRVDRANRFMKSVPATLMAGTIQKHGQLIIDTLSMKDGISVSLAVENSDLYSQYKNKSLKEIFASKVRNEWNEDVETLANYLLRIRFNYDTDDFTIFPVAVSPYDEDDAKIYQYNNEGTDYLVWNARTVREDDIVMSVTDGYGLSPFLYLYKMIDLLFGQMGYSVISNCLDKDPYRDIVLLNNCSDTIVKGVIRYSDLVPSCTLSEFIDFLFKKFGIHVRVDSTAKTVEAVMLQELLESMPEYDISDKLVDDFDILIEDSSRIVLSSKTSIDGTTPAAETFDKLLELYGYYIEVTEQEYEDIINNDDPAYSDCLIMRQETGQFYELRRKIGSSMAIPNFIGTNYFKYDRNNSSNSENLNSPDVMPAIIYNSVPYMYIGDRLHYNTSYNNSKDDAEQSIIIAWKINHQIGNRLISFGTTQKYFNRVRHKDFSLTFYEMYKHFWSNYNNILLNNKITVKGTMLYNACDISSLDMTKLKFYRGQKLLPLKTTLEVSGKLKNKNSEFLLVKEPLNMESDSIITAEKKNLFKWDLKVDTAEAETIKRLSLKFPKYYNGFGNVFYVPSGADICTYIENEFKPKYPDNSWVNHLDDFPKYIECYNDYYIEINSDQEKTVYLPAPHNINEKTQSFESSCVLYARTIVYEYDYFNNPYGKGKISEALAPPKEGISSECMVHYVSVAVP